MAQPITFLVNTEYLMFSVNHSSDSYTANWFNET